MVKIEKLFMDGQKRFSHISPKVLNALDRDFSGWQDLVPADQASKLNEESLINLIKDKKRSEIYRTVSDRRNALTKEVYEGSDRSFAELTQEYAAFSYEQTHKWFDMEEKLSSIILEFRAAKPVLDVSKLGDNLNVVTERIDGILDAKASNYSSFLSSSMNNRINEISGGNQEVTEELNALFGTQINKFKTDGRNIAEDQKRFINGPVKSLVQLKLDQIKKGDLDANALQRSDLFTDEEAQSIAREHEKMVVGIAQRRRRVNVNAFEDVVSRSDNVQSKDNFLEQINALPDDLLSKEAKQVMAEAIKEDFILPEKEDSAGGRSKRVAPAVALTAGLASFILKMASITLKVAGKKQKEEWEKTEGRLLIIPKVDFFDDATLPPRVGDICSLWGFAR